MLRQYRSVYIYGAGGFAKRLTDALERHGIAVSAYLTQDGGSSPYFGQTRAVTTVRPYDDEAVLIGVFNPDADCGALSKALTACGFKNVYYPWNLINYLGSHPENYWMNNFGHSLNSFADKIRKVESLLTDDESRDLFRSIVDFRQSGKAGLLPEPSLNDQYRPSDLIEQKEIPCLVDVGAYTGDTLLDFTSAGFVIQQALTFEPDEKNRRTLQQNVAALGIASINLPFGLGRRAAQFQLTENGSGSSLGSSTVGTLSQKIIQSVALDEIIAGMAIDYIKIDVEGFEASALMGMKKLLRACEPRLAISLYHKPLDFIHLPLLLNAIVPHKRMAIRQHRYNLFDTVLYWNYY